MKKILSIDGGGIRGIIPGMILVALEDKLKRESKNPDAAIVDYFDFFAGTSTGGILTCLLLCPSDTDPLRPRFSAREALDLYLQHGNEIFKMSFFKIKYHTACCILSLGRAAEIIKNKLVVPDGV